MAQEGVPAFMKLKARGDVNILNTSKRVVHRAKILFKIVD
jgi:hypothetical protein